MSLVVPLGMVAKKVNNYIVDATDNAAGNLKFDSTTVQTYTVPSGKRWIILYGTFNRSDSGTLTIYGYDSADKVICQFAVESAATGYSDWPTAPAKGPFILDEDEYILITAGVAQGATAAASCVVLEFAKP